MKVGTFKNNDALAKLIQCFRFKNKIKLKKKIQRENTYSEMTAHFLSGLIFLSSEK